MAKLNTIRTAFARWEVKQTTPWHVVVPAGARATWKSWRPKTMGDEFDDVTWVWPSRTRMFAVPAFEAAAIVQKRMRRKRYINAFMAGVEHAILVQGGSIARGRYTR